MIKRPKKQSYNRKFISPILYFLLCVILPAYLSFQLKTLSIKILFLFYFVNAAVFFVLLNKYYRRKYSLGLSLEDIQEEINISSDQIIHESKNKLALQKKLTRYNSLKNIIEDINQKVDLDSVANTLVSEVFSLIAANKGTCILYLVDSQTQINLSLFKSRKEDKELVIKAKEGDIFDAWVLKHGQSLLVEDAKKDFRFDLEKLKAQDTRPISSLIAAPLISHHRFLGILRLDNSLDSFYSQDDSRLLNTICDIGAVALENAEFFEKTQDLAIRDGLTSLYTKGFFLEQLKDECRRSLRRSQPLSLLMLDIDFFKRYNDKFGHTAGDIVLQKISAVIIEATKKTNAVICRFGGEEFCIMLGRIDKDEAGKIAEAVRQAIEKCEVVLRREKTIVSVSIGVASFFSDAHDEEELILKADKALYQAKEQGRNRVVVC